MKLKRRESVALGVLLVALGVLAVDKLLLGTTPGTAEAAGRSGRRGGEAADFDRAQLDDLLIAGRAPTSAPSSFDPPGMPDRWRLAVPPVFSWQRLTDGAGALTAPGAEAAAISEKPIDSAEAFVAAHQLSATVLGPRPMAVIDGRTYRRGETIDGYTLDAIADGRCELVSDGTRITLEVPSPWQHDAKSRP